MQVNIKLDSIDKVREFVNTVNRFHSDFDLISGRYVIDAKSIMGIFSLDLSKPLSLDIHENDTDDHDELMAALKPFLV
ncbi:MAG: HPr family phosphocarrier protein [Eubacteriales bacterium]|nr:HPr family phosphocarrier protein [Eubacteriales bacterium]